MGSILVSPAFNPEIVIDESRNFRNARIVIPNNTDSSGFPLSEPQKQARENYDKAMESYRIVLADRDELQRLIVDIKDICNRKPSGWKQKILDRVGNFKYKGNAGNIIAGIFSGGWYAIAAEIKKKKEAKEHCDGVQPNGKWDNLLKEADTLTIPASKKFVDDAYKEVERADDREFKRRQEEAANEQAMNLAKTATERERIRLENERITKQREADLKELQARQSAEIEAKKDRNKTIMVVTIGVAAIAIGGFFLLRK
jgi:hypothetical protein